MKRLSLFISFCLSLMLLQAQSDRTITQYLLPQFSEGVVQKKSGEQIKAMMNYNTLTEEMIFQQNGQPLALTQLETIDSVIIQNRTFIPANNKFKERKNIKNDMACLVKFIGYNMRRNLMSIY